MIKNAIIYTAKLLSAHGLIDHLDETEYSLVATKPTALQLSTIGLSVNPITKGVVSAFQGGYCLQFTKWEKKINVKALNAKVQERVGLIRDREVSNKEIVAIKDLVITELLPTLLPVPKTITCYYLEESEQLIFDSTSTNDCEEVISLLRKSLGSLPAELTSFPPQDVLQGHLEYCFGSDERYLVQNEITVCESIKLTTGDQKVTIENVDLFEEGVREEVLAYITGGFKLKYIELCYQPNAVTFTLVDGFKLSKVSFDGFQASGEDYVNDWLRESLYSTLVIGSIVESLNLMKPGK